MKDFFKVVDLQAVFGHIPSFAPVDTEVIETTRATGRVLAESVQAAGFETELLDFLEIKHKDLLEQLRKGVLTSKDEDTLDKVAREMAAKYESNE